MRTGVIFTVPDGKLLAVSVPYYDIRMDLTVDSLTDDVFYGKCRCSFERSLASTFGDKSMDRI